MKQTALLKIGGATGCCIPEPFLKALNLQAGDKVMMTVDQGRLIMTKVEPNLEDLLQGHLPLEPECFNKPQGREQI